MMYHTACLVYLISALWGGGTSVDRGLPPLETFLLDPLEFTQVRLWVPADKTGPVINRSCRATRESSSCLLPALVKHTKSDFCFGHAARMLAEYTARCHMTGLPLTILNGWQWEYASDVCQHEAIAFELAPRGGSWEASWEAVLARSQGTVTCRWLQMAQRPSPVPHDAGSGAQSDIEILAFGALRIRDGYPKIRQLP